MKIKTGDMVIVVSGSRKDRNKKGKVLRTLADVNKVVVEGINIKKKIQRDPASGKKTMVDVEFPIDVSNVMFFDEKAKKGTRIGYQTNDGKKTRLTKASGSSVK